MAIRRNEKQRGFTLVELMVVVVILGTLIALVGPNIWRMLFTSREGAAKAQMHSFEQAINLYKMENKKLPDTLQELTETDGRSAEPYLDHIPLDPWGNEYDYRPMDRKNYKIISYGEDGLPDTEDDIVWPEQEGD